MLTVYGIPNCDTVKKARRWLDEHAAEHIFVDYRETPLAADHVADWVATLGAKAMKNTSGGAYRALPDEKKGWDDARWATEFAANPMLIKRPLIVKSGVAVQVGFRGTDEDFVARLLE